ncbi:MAG: AI-2E family transporter, partial [Actinomycetota bacterium]|nr:AI-2E family transporter [Actinomycetota bacterium]
DRPSALTGRRGGAARWRRERCGQLLGRGHGLGTVTAMAAPEATERLRLTPRSAVAAVALLGLTLAVLALLSASRRVLGWVAAAAAIAGLAWPAVARLGRHVPRGVAVAVVVLAGVGVAGVTTWRVVEGIGDETKRLRRAAPAAVRRIEQRDGRLAELAREARLAQRTRRFVEEVPERLRGGTPAEALRAAATRGVAYLATGVLSVFFLLHGPRLAASAADQVRDPRRRALLERAAAAAFARGFGYARGTVAMALAAGLFAYAVASVAHVPGAAPLGLWVALWDAVPYFGALVGAAPVVVLGGAQNPAQGLVLAAAFVGYELVETFVAQRRLERRTVHVGPFLTTAGGFAGLELYGLGGALFAILALALAMAALDELAPPAATTRAGGSAQPP